MIHITEGENGKICLNILLYDKLTHGRFQSFKMHFLLIQLILLVSFINIAVCFFINTILSFYQYNYFVFITNIFHYYDNNWVFLLMGLYFDPLLKLLYFFIYLFI